MNSPSNTTPDKIADVQGYACLALGSNLASGHGSPAATVLAAMDEIAGWSPRPLLRSSLWSSRPVDCPPGAPDFINAVVAMVPGVAESPRSLLTRMLDAERRFGRRRGAVANAPRCLDLDLICFGDQQMSAVDLTLPHPRAHSRSFVLAPLAEIAPNLQLPGQSRTVVELLELLELQDSENPGVVRIEP